MDSGQAGGGMFQPTDAYGAHPVRSWPARFPSGVVHADIQTVRAAAATGGEALDGKGRSAAYVAAKTGGDAEAAARVVEAVIDPDVVTELGRCYAGAVLVAAHAEEAQGLNALPAAYAAAISDLTGLPYNDAIRQSNVVGHTGGTQRQRLMRPALFKGPVQRGLDYILVDDTLASGATFASLRNYIESHGGGVAAVTALAAAPDKQGRYDPRQVPIRPDTLARLEKKGLAGSEVNAILKGHGVAPSIEHLSEGQGRVLVRYPDADALGRSSTSRKRRSN